MLFDICQLVTSYCNMKFLLLYLYLFLLVSNVQAQLQSLDDILSEMPLNQTDDVQGDPQVAIQKQLKNITDEMDINFNALIRFEDDRRAKTTALAEANEKIEQTEKTTHKI